jgi:molecular chaperone GrpE
MTMEPSHQPHNPHSETEHQEQAQEQPDMKHTDKLKAKQPLDAQIKEAAKDIGSPFSKTNEELEQLKAETAALKDQLLRTMAEAENIRKRAQRDVEEAGKYAVTSFARDLINVLENLHRAEESIPKDQISDNALLNNIFQGVEMTKRELLGIFERHGIKRIDPKGEKFDHNFHQAMVQIPDDSCPPDTVVQVLQAGYVIKDRLLRPALVGVSKSTES